MTREARQRYITQAMQRGETFENVYKESDGIPYFKWWIYEPGQTSGSLVSDMTLDQVNNYVNKNCPYGTTYHKDIRLGYTIDL